MERVEESFVEEAHISKPLKEMHRQRLVDRRCFMASSMGTGIIRQDSTGQV